MLSAPLLLGAFGAVDWLIVGGYLALVLGLGAWASKGQEDESTYFLGGRSVPLWAVTLSIVATSLSAATYVGLPALTYRASGNLTYLILNIGGVLGSLAVALVFLPRLYRAGTTTIYGAIGQRYGAGGTLAASVTFLVGRLLASGARLFIAGIAFSYILFGDTTLGSVLTAIVVFGVVGTIYTSLGGIKAVIWTDTLQIVLVVGAALASIVILLNAIPLPLGELWAHLDGQGKLRVWESGFDAEGFYDYTLGFTIVTAFAVSFQNAGSYGCDHDLVQRMMTTRSPWQASASLMLSQVIAMPIVLLFMVIGLLLSVYYDPQVMGAALPADAVTDARRVYPQFLLEHMPTGLAGLAMAGLFAAAMSSLDSAINAMAASLRADVIEPYQALRGEPVETKGEQALAASRMTVAGTGGLLIGFAAAAALLQHSGGQRLIDFALGVMTFALSGLLGVFAAALCTRRGNVASVVAALVTGAWVIVVLQQKWVIEVAWPWWMAIASPISFAVCCLGSPPAEPLPEAPGSDTIKAAER